MIIPKPSLLFFASLFIAGITTTDLCWTGNLMAGILPSKFSTRKFNVMELPLLNTGNTTSLFLEKLYNSVALLPSTAPPTSSNTYHQNPQPF